MIDIWLAIKLPVRSLIGEAYTASEYNQVRSCDFQICSTLQLWQQSRRKVNNPASDPNLLYNE